MSYFMLIAGDGESSRANTEALLEDYFYSKGDGGVLVLAFKDAPSKSQKIAAMYAQEKGKDLLYFSLASADTTGLPGASINPTNDTSDSPITNAIAFLSGQPSVVFVLGVEGETSEEVVRLARANHIKTLNLCQGLIEVGEITYADLVSAVTKEQLHKEAELKEREIEKALTPAVKDLGEAVQGAVDWEIGMPKPVVDALVNLFKVAQGYGLHL